jgi:hypothetical protein
VLLDDGDIVVHIFNEEARRFYDLERLWGDAKLVSTNQTVQESGVRSQESGAPHSFELDGSPDAEE